MIRAIMAMDQISTIGSNGFLPWPVHSNDLARFRKLTMGSICVMGRKTADSLKQPLEGRRNLVLTRNHHYKKEGFETIHDLSGIEDCWIIGGAELFKLTEIFWSELYLTIFAGVCKGDTWYTINLKHWILAEAPIEYRGSPINATYFHYKRC